MPDINLTDILSAVGYHLGNLVGEVRGKRDREYNAMASAVVQDPSLGDVPKFRSVMKHYGWQDQDFEVLKAHRSVSSIAELLKTVDQTGAQGGGQGGQGPAQMAGRVVGSMGGQAGGMGANMSPTPTAMIQTPAAAIPQAPAPAIAARPGQAPPQSRAQAIEQRLGTGTLQVREGNRQRGMQLTLKGSGAAAGKPTTFAQLQQERQDAVVRGDYRGAAEIDSRIKVLTTPPAEAAYARTTATEEAKLDPALVQQKLNVKEREKLLAIAPAGTLKALRTKDGKDVPAGSLTNEQVLAMTKSGELVPKQTVQDAFLSTASRLLFGSDLFGGTGAPAAGAAPTPAGVEAGAGWTWTPAQ